MPEKIPDHQQIAEVTPNDSSVVNRFMLSYRSRIHFEEAIGIAATTEGTDVMNALTGVARNMAEVSIPPTVALDRLIIIRDNYPEQGHNRFFDIGVGNISAMLGKFSELPSSLKSWSAYLYAAEFEIRQGNDPTSLLNEVIEMIEKHESHYDDHFSTVMEYAKVGRVLHKGGLDPMIAFSKAEAEIVRAKSEARVFDERSCEQLAEGYADVGRYSDSLRMIEVIPDDTRRPHYAAEIIEYLGERELDLGSLDGAIETTGKFGLIILSAQLLAKRAVAEASHSFPYIDSIVACELVSSEHKLDGYETYLEKVYPLIGLAHAKGGDDESAQRVFNTLRGKIKSLDFLYRSDVSLALARAIDSSGYNATESYRQAFGWADKYKKADPKSEAGYGMSISMYGNGIKALIEEGHFDLASEYLNRYHETPWFKSALIASLAKEEAKKGFTQAEIAKLSASDIQQIVLNDHPQSRQALEYFGL